MPGREREGKQKLVLHERERVQRPLRKHHLRTALGVERRELPFVSCEKDFRPLRDRPVKVIEASLTRQRHVSTYFDVQCRAALRVRCSFNAPSDIRRTFAEHVRNACERMRVDGSFEHATVPREPESIELRPGVLVSAGHDAIVEAGLGSSVRSGAAAASGKRRILTLFTGSVKIIS